jgi:pyroglutamyl-peptidase
MKRKRSMPRRGPVLLTGFEPFGGHELNPSGEIVKRLDGSTIAGTKIVGRVLPVVMDGLAARIAVLIAEIRPRAVIGLGLAAGETVIRLERQATNRAEFRIPDNAGVRLNGQPIDPQGPPTRPTRLPIERIHAALVAKGIPARLSDSAGLYLCNVAMYEILAKGADDIPSGFVHLPHLRAEVARRLAETPAPAEPANFASMEYPTLRRAVEIIVEETVRRSARLTRQGPAPRA